MVLDESLSVSVSILTPSNYTVDLRLRPAVLLPQLSFVRIPLAKESIVQQLTMSML